MRASPKCKSKPKPKAPFQATVQSSPVDSPQSTHWASRQSVHRQVRIHHRARRLVTSTPASQVAGVAGGVTWGT